jgi:aspartyl-tRNA(Asn)/glutamyl-tRNA(Gln) amidotransferase subunit C
MSVISKEEVLRIAKMSRITVHEEEVDQLTKQLNDILTYAARVSEIAGLDQHAQQCQDSKNTNVWRQDTVVPCNGERILAAAPVHEADYFVVPAIIEHE